MLTIFNFAKMGLIGIHIRHRKIVNNWTNEKILHFLLELFLQ